MIERYINPPDTLEQVLDRLDPGDVLVLDAGEYRVNLVLTRPCVLRGTGGTTVLQGSPGTGPVVRVHAPGVRLEHLSLEHLGARGVVLEVEPGIKVQLEGVRNLAGRVKGTRSLGAAAPPAPLSRTLSAEEALPWPFETPEFPPKREKRKQAVPSVPVRSHKPELSRPVIRALELPSDPVAEQVTALVPVSSSRQELSPPKGESFPDSPRQTVWQTLRPWLVRPWLVRPWLVRPWLVRGWQAAQPWILRALELGIRLLQSLRLRLLGQYPTPAPSGLDLQALSVLQAEGGLLSLRRPGVLERIHKNGTREAIVLPKLPKHPKLLAISTGGQWLAWLEQTGELHCVPIKQGLLKREGLSTSPGGPSSSGVESSSEQGSLGKGWTRQPLKVGLALGVSETPSPLVLLLTPEGIEALDARSGQSCWSELLPVGSGGCLLVHDAGVWISNLAGQSWYVELSEQRRLT